MSKKKQKSNARIGEYHKALKWAVSDLTPELILAITCVVLGAAIAMLVFTNYGYNLATRSGNGSSEPNSSNISIINVDYDVQSFVYNADANCLAGKSSERCLLDNYGAKNSDYAIINSSDQLNRLMAVLKDISGESFEYAIDASFFESGSIVAVVKEEGYTDFKLTSVYRDENYDLHLQTKTMSVDGIGENTSHLLLVKVPNIQPKSVTVVDSRD